MNAKQTFKYMQTLDLEIYKKLKARAKPLGITVQELVRVKLIPEFLYGPVQLNPELVRKLVRNGSRKVPPNRRLPKSA